jgi:hypothetical protein
VIDSQAAALLQADSSLIVGSVDAAGMPYSNRAWAIRVLDEGTRLRVVISDDAAVLCDNIRTTGRVAITATNIITLDSVQVKGEGSNLGPENDEDRRQRQDHIEMFKAAVQRVDGTRYEVMDRLIPVSFLAFDLAVFEVFDQTPGPKAGKQTAPAPA